MQTHIHKPRILLITRNLPPLVGGMERMMQQLALGISQYANLTVIGPTGCKEHLPAETTVRETSSQLAPFLMFSTWLALRECRKTRYDTVIGGSGLIAPTLRILALLFRCRTLIYLHGLDLVVNNLLYQRIFVPCLRHIDSVAVNSRNTRDIAISKGIYENRITVINPGTSLPAPAEHASRLDFRKRYSIPFERYLLFTGRMTKRKGLSGFLAYALPAILESEPAVGLVVVGEQPQDSLNQLGEEADVQHQISAHNLRESVMFVGKLTDSDLEICYAEAALQIFPLVHVHGDVEGFGMVAIEAAACGTPTVAFDLGGVSDAVSVECGHLVPPDDFGSFASEVIGVLRNREPNAQRCRAHASQFSWQNYNQAMQQLIEKLAKS